MPYKINKKAGKFCVVKSDTGEEIHCHTTQEQALAQMKALYANEATPTERMLKSKGWI